MRGGSPRPIARSPALTGFMHTAGRAAAKSLPLGDGDGAFLVRSRRILRNEHVRGGWEGFVTPSISVAVVDAETSGNVGTIARAMKNFGVTELLLVNPPPIGPGTEASGFAGRAREDVLKDATEVTFDDLVEEYHTVAFTSLGNPTDTKHIRYPVSTPRQLVERLQDVDGKTALVFGRERIGLTNEELAQMDELCSIPASPDYPTMNLGQSATIALYELRQLTIEESQLPADPHPRAEPAAIEALYDRYVALLDAIDYPAERREKAETVFRRILGRADPTHREVSTLHGVFKRYAYTLGVNREIPRSAKDD